MPDEPQRPSRIAEDYSAIARRQRDLAEQSIARNGYVLPDRMCDGCNNRGFIRPTPGGAWIMCSGCYNRQRRPVPSAV